MLRISLHQWKSFNILHIFTNAVWYNHLQFGTKVCDGLLMLDNHIHHPSTQLCISNIAFFQHASLTCSQVMVTSNYILPHWFHRYFWNSLTVLWQQANGNVCTNRRCNGLWINFSFQILSTRVIMLHVQASFIPLDPGAEVFIHLDESVLLGQSVSLSMRARCRFCEWQQYFRSFGRSVILLWFVPWWRSQLNLLNVLTRLMRGDARGVIASSRSLFALGPHCPFWLYISLWPRLVFASCYQPVHHLIRMWLLSRLVQLGISLEHIGRWSISRVIRDESQV